VCCRAEFKPVGTTRFVRFDARHLVIQAMSEFVRQGVPALICLSGSTSFGFEPPRERREDVPRVVEHAIRRFNAANGTYLAVSARPTRC
jgi:hypothetical protein